MQDCLTDCLEFPNIELPVVYTQTLDNIISMLQDMRNEQESKYEEYNVNKCCNIVKNECNNTVQYDIICICTHFALF